MKVHPRTVIAALAITLIPLATNPALAGVAPTMTDRLLPPGVDPTDEFAASLDMEGDLAVVGAPLDDELGEDAGAAYVYRRTGGVWSLEAKLLSASGAPGHDFGRGVAVSGNQIVVLAPLEEDENEVPGFVHTFRWDGVQWSETDAFNIHPASRSCGTHIDLEGDLLGVGSMIFIDPGSGTGVGSAALIYRRINGAWAHEHTIPELGLLTNSASPGPPIVIENGVVAIGAYKKNRLGPFIGEVIIARQSDGAWTESVIRQQGDEEPMGLFGWAIDMDNNSLVIGTIEEFGFRNRTMFVYRWDGSQWSREAELITGPDTSQNNLPFEDGLGYEIAIDGDVIVACDRWNRTKIIDKTLIYPSVTYVYQRNGVDWSLKQQFDIDDGGVQEKFGTQIAIEGSTAIIGNNIYFDGIDTPSAAFIVNLCGADLNGDGVTDASDLGLFLDLFGDDDGGIADINGDGVVDAADLGVLIREFGEPCL